MPEETPKPANAGGVSPPPATGGTPPRKGRWWPVVAIIILVLIMGGLFARVMLSKPKPAPPPPPVMVSTVKATKGDMGIYVDGLLGLVLETRFGSKPAARQARTITPSVR